MDVVKRVLSFLVVFSFFAIFFCIVFAKDFALIFFTGFWFFAALSFVLGGGHSAIKRKTLKGVIIIAMFVIAGVAGKYAYVDIQTKTVFEGYLSKVDGQTAYEATLQVPENMPASDKNHTIYAIITYSLTTYGVIPFEDRKVELFLRSSTGTQNYKFSLNPPSKDATSVTVVVRTGWNFPLPVDNYTVDFVYNKSKILVSSVQIQFREKR